MRKGEVKEYCKGKFLVFLMLFILSVNLVAASDIAYIYKSKGKVDENVLDVFSELGLDYDLIDERYLPLDLSDYKMIFVGDERLRKPDYVPVTEKPSIIANYYFGEEWGLTDSDGISKLASTSPLEVKKDNKIIPVYTQARYSLGSISIPYYYLDKENKAPQMQRVAATYIGTEETGESSEFGDVISYAYPGTNLVNNKKTKEKVCFFGIVESDYWTPAAREMFKDCIGFVSITCSSDSECGEEKIGENYCEGNKIYRDVTNYGCENPGTTESECVWDSVKELVEVCEDSCSNGKCVYIDCYEDEDCDDQDSYTKDVCINSGKENSYCQHYPLECLKDSDCGIDGYVGEGYCEKENVYQDYQDFECLNNECFDSIEPRLIEECADICRQGECIERECVFNSDCQEDYYSDNYCENNNVYQDLHTFSCQQEMCAENVAQELVEECADVCVEGECKEIICKLNSDCGENHFLGSLYCSGGNVYEDFTSFLCQEPGTLDSYCTDYTKPILRDYCEGDCINGECITCINGECITCFNDAGCGKDGFIGKSYCEGKDVYQDYQTFSCINSGTSESDCSSEVSPQLIEECADVCVEGECKEIICYTDEDCDDFNSYTYDECNNPGTVDSYCTNTEINCVTDNDCGATGFIGEEFCYEDDVFKNYKESKCINPKTKQSYCEIEEGPVFLLDCGEDECGNWSYYCKGGDVWKSRDCYDKGCAEGGCFSELISEEELAEECAYSCENGGCAGECETDADCDDGLFCNGQEACIGGTCAGAEDVDCSVFDIQEIATCGNSPDDNLLTRDYAPGFNSVCDEELDACTLSSSELTHTCDIDNCGAECITKEDCPEKCTKTSHKLYNLVGCSDCACEYSGYECVVGKCGAECDEDSDCGCEEDYCDGTTLVDYPDYSSCGTAGSEGCLCQTCEAVLIENSPECGYAEPYCGDNNLDPGEECDDGNKDNGDGCDENCEIEYECEINEECSDDYYGKSYCLNDDVYRDLHDFSCVDYGCVEDVIPGIEEDCGESYCEKWLYYCEEDGVYKKRTCYNKGCEQGSCFSDPYTEKKLVEECKYDCADGSCTEPVCGDGIIEGEECEFDSDCDDQDEYTADSCNNCECVYESIVCYDNDDCGEDHWLEEEYCECTRKLWDYWISYECINPGTLDSYCESSAEEMLKEDCGEDECGKWQRYCKGKEVWKEKTCYERGCENSGCYSEESIKEVFVEECKYDCADGSCTGECVKDSDCEDDYYGKNYCKNNDIYHDLYDFSCVEGECIKEIKKKKAEDCGESYCEDWEYYCEGGDSYRSRTCYEKGCVDGECYENSYEENELTEECAECGSSGCDLNWDFDCDKNYFCSLCNLTGWKTSNLNIDLGDWCNLDCGKC